MQMFNLIADAVVILTLAVIVLSVFVVLRRFLTDLSEARVQRLRARMQHRLDEFLDGTADAKAVIGELAQAPDIALGVLVGAASRLSRHDRRPLRDLFEHFHFPQKGVAGLRSRRWAVRVHAASQLGYMSDDDAVPALIKALDDEMLDVRLAAAHALMQLGAVQAVQPILRSLALPAVWPLQRCAEILYGMGGEVIEPLLGFLSGHGRQDQDPAVVVAVRVLGMLRAGRAVPLIIGLIHSPDVELRLSSAKALGQIGDPQAIPALCEALGDPAWEVRSTAAQALGHLGSQAAILPLEQRLSDPAWWARCNAAESLYRLGPPGQDALKRIMAGHPDAFARDISRQILEEHGVIPLQEALTP
jgi:hypothetical protein